MNNLDPTYLAGYEAGLGGDDACPHFPFTPSWWLWRSGHFAGHQVLCAELEAILYVFPQD